MTSDAIDSLINDYGMIGDTVSAALINRRARIDFLCWPRFDSPSVFLRLLDPAGGCCAVEAATGAVRASSRRYREDSLILETTLDYFAGANDVVRSGQLCVADFMPVRQRELSADDLVSPDLIATSRIVRKLTCLSGSVRVRVIVRPRFDYGRRRPVLQLESNCAALLQQPGGGSSVRVDGSGSIRCDQNEGQVVSDFTLIAGQSGWIALTDGPPGRVPPVRSAGEIDAALAATDDYWTAWSRRCHFVGRQDKLVRRSLITLKALTYSPSGAIVAAPTFGLPEAPGFGRNYDYRYNWLRDASFTVRAFCSCGYQREARAFLHFFARGQIDRGRAVPVMLTLDGQLPVGDEQTLDHLRGYARSLPVRVGNAAATQLQLDANGELLNALHSFYDMTGKLSPDASERGLTLAELVTNIADAVMKRWREPDAGIWEFRGPREHFVHSKAMSWVALDRAVELARPLRLSAEARVWQACADEIQADYLAHGWNESVGAYTQAYGSETLDAAVVRPALFGAYDTRTTRFRRTVSRIRQHLSAPTQPDLIYRYHRPDGFEGQEGAFCSCGFWMMAVPADKANLAETEALFDRLLARGNDLGLFSEEVDPTTGAALGNFPQGFTHMSVVLAAGRLNKLREGLNPAICARDQRSAQAREAADPSSGS